MRRRAGPPSLLVLRGDDTSRAGRAVAARYARRRLRMSAVRHRQTESDPSREALASDAALAVGRKLEPQPISARRFFAAFTILVRAGRTSAQPRVLRPQSGFTHSRSIGTCSAAYLMSAMICCSGGMF